MGCRAHIAWPWSGRSLPKGNQWECWDPGLEPNVVMFPQCSCHQLSDQPEASQVDILSHGWLAGQLQLASWLTTYQTKCQPDPPLGKDILWLCVWLLWPHRPVVRGTPLVETSHGQVRIPMAPMRLQARLAFGQMSNQVNIMSDAPPQLKKSSGQGKIIDPLDDFYTMKDLLPGMVTI